MKNILNQPEQNRYQEFTMVIPPNGRRVIDFPFNSFEVYAQTGNALTIILGDNVDEIKMNAVGRGLELDQVYRRITLCNPSVVTITVTFALAIGKIINNTITSPLSVSGSTVFSTVNPSFVAITNQFAVANTAVYFGDTGIPYSIHAGATNLFIGDASVTTTTGFLIPANTTLQINFGGELYGIRVLAGAVTAYVLALI